MAARVPSGKRLLILELLMARGKMTGWDLGEADESLRSGTIYTTLMRLEEDGFVRSKKDTNSGRPGPAPRHYEITGEGKRAVQAAWVFAGVRI
jgi:DNA-binding PadR family transcriptional regulator